MTMRMSERRSAPIASRTAISGMHAPSDIARDDPIQSDGRQQQSKSTRRGKQKSRESFLR
jgi:hypothetical protein